MWEPLPLRLRPRHENPLEEGSGGRAKTFQAEMDFGLKAQTATRTS
jgi:hypothetical protein